MRYIDSITDWLDEKTLIAKVGILIAIVVVISGIYWYFFWSPNNQKLNNLERSLQNKQKRLAELENIEKDLPEFEKEFERLNREFQVASLKLPKEEEIPSLIDSIYSDISASGLEPQVFAPKGRKPRDIYAEIPIEMEVIGTYHELAGFFDRISRLPRIVNVQDLNLTRRNGGNPENVILKADFTTVTFRLLPNKELDTGGNNQQ